MVQDEIIVPDKSLEQSNLARRRLSKGKLKLNWKVRHGATGHDKKLLVAPDPKQDPSILHSELRIRLFSFLPYLKRSKKHKLDCNWVKSIQSFVDSKYTSIVDIMQAINREVMPHEKCSC
jgi:hypothetical protein